MDARVAAMRWMLLLLLSVGIGAASGLLPPYHLFIAGSLSVLAMVTMAMGLLVGVIGLLSLASPVFLGFGAYAGIHLVGELGLPFFVAVPIVLAVAWCLGFALGIIVLRLEGFYLAVVTLGALSIFGVLLKTGGPIVGNGYGLMAPYPTLPVLGVLTPDLAAKLAIGLCLLVGALVYNLINSRVGRAWFAVKNHATAAATLGINISLAKALAFATTGTLIALAGTLQGYILGATSPKSYDFVAAIIHVTMVVLAGLNGSVLGACLAPVALFLVPELYPELGHWREVFFAGVLLLALMMPNGRLAALLRKPMRELSARPRP